MKITISGTNKELAQFLKLAALDEKFKSLVEKNALAKEEMLDDSRLETLYGRTSFETLYLWHLISIEGPKRHSDAYLTVDELERFGIKERSASASIGGLKKVTKSLGMNDVMTLKLWRVTRDAEPQKRYFVLDEAKPYILQLIDAHRDAYRDWLQEWLHEWPSDEQRWLQTLLDEGIVSWNVPLTGGKYKKRE